MLGYDAGNGPGGRDGEICRSVERGKKLEPFGLEPIFRERVTKLKAGARSLVKKIKPQDCRGFRSITKKEEGGK